MRNLCCLSLVLYLTISGLCAAEGKSVKDVSYAEGNRLTKLDLYAPASGTEMPVVIWIHGGGWRIGDKRSVQEKPYFFNDHGMLLVSLNYRLHPEADYQSQAEDIARGIRWVHDHAAEYGGSSGRIFLIGHSAGAHLAALVSTDERYLNSEGLKLSNLRGTILLDGAGYDIPRQVAGGGPRNRNLYTTIFGEDEAGQRKASPIEYVKSGKGIPPFLILFVASRPESRLQSNLLSDKLNSEGSLCLAIAAENKTHSTINREIGLEGDEPTKEILKFLLDRSR